MKGYVDFVLCIKLHHCLYKALGDTLVLSLSQVAVSTLNYGVCEGIPRDLPVAVTAAVVLAKTVDSKDLTSSTGVCERFWEFRRLSYWFIEV